MKFIISSPTCILRCYDTVSAVQVIQSPVFDMCQGHVKRDTLLQKDLNNLHLKNYKRFNFR
jgi:hypothetical protein